LHTTRSWHFLGLENNGTVSADSAWTKAKFGENTIIANIDTGMLVYLKLNKSTKVMITNKSLRDERGAPLGVPRSFLYE